MRHRNVLNEPQIRDAIICHILLDRYFCDADYTIATERCVECDFPKL